jgi:hypothetical protein
MKALRLAIVVLIATTLIVAAVGKLLDNRHFAELLARWELFPHWSLLPLGLVTSLSELLLAMWLLSGWRLAGAAITAALFHLGYVSATVLALLRGIRLPDCGCFGIFFPHPLNWTMAAEDSAYLIASMVLFLLARESARRKSR